MRKLARSSTLHPPTFCLPGSRPKYAPSLARFLLATPALSLPKVISLPPSQTLSTFFCPLGSLSKRENVSFPRKILEIMAGSFLVNTLRFDMRKNDVPTESSTRQVLGFMISCEKLRASGCMERDEGCGVQGSGVGSRSTFPKRPLSRTSTLTNVLFGQVLGDRATANMADADQLSYLKLCIRETLRL